MKVARWYKLQTPVYRISSVLVLAVW